MALNKIIAEARTRQLQDKIRYHLGAAGIAVMAEEESHENHVNRLNYAGVILRGGANIFQVALALVTNLTIAAKIEADEDYDGDIAYVITTIYDAFANAEGV